jgi:2-(1,2-epoxy-1,2-dihydrophenyl)acetyl-CoA isomerase
MSESIQFEKKENLAIVRLNRPQKFNAINSQMAFALQAVLDECRSDKQIRAIYLTGNGKAFCAGQDLAELTGDNPPAMNTILSEYYNPIISRIRQMPKPVIAAVNGVAAGAGANIAIACDLVVASLSSSFIQAFSRIGLIPDSAGTFFLPRLIGLQRATALMMLGDKLSAADAMNWGLIYKVYPDETFQVQSLELANQLSAMPTRALALTKEALNASLNNNLQEQLELEDRLQTAATQTWDYKEGVAAFLEKRTAQFKGE